MKKLVAFLAFSLLAGASARAAGTDKWPACAPILAFAAADIGVASYEMETSTQGRWVCLMIDRATQKVRSAKRDEFDAAFPGAIAAGNRKQEDCQEVLAPPVPGTNAACVSPRVFCGGVEITVRVSSTVASLPCPAQLFSAVTLVGDRLWVGIAPLDPYRREYPGAGMLVQVLDGTVSSRLTPQEVGGRKICAIRRDPYTSSIWATTESGLTELTPSGRVKRTLKIRSIQRPATGP